MKFRLFLPWLVRYRRITLPWLWPYEGSSVPGLFGTMAKTSELKGVSRVPLPPLYPESRSRCSVRSRISLVSRLRVIVPRHEIMLDIGLDASP
jgi:hypothetical protein